jgi:hypothetical protein
VENALVVFRLLQQHKALQAMQQRNIISSKCYNYLLQHVSMPCATSYPSSHKTHTYCKKFDQREIVQSATPRVAHPCMPAQLRDHAPTILFSSVVNENTASQSRKSLIGAVL